MPAGGAGPSPSSETLVLQAPENALGQCLALRRSEFKWRMDQTGVWERIHSLEAESLLAGVAWSKSFNLSLSFLILKWGGDLFEGLFCFT